MCFRNKVSAKLVTVMLSVDAAELYQDLEYERIFKISKLKWVNNAHAYDQVEMLLVAADNEPILQFELDDNKHKPCSKIDYKRF